MGTRIDEIVEGIYRISTWQPQYGITFNQFLIADERPALIHTGMLAWRAVQQAFEQGSGEATVSTEPA